MGKLRRERQKVKTRDRAAFEEVGRVLERHRIPVLLSQPRRHVYATGTLPLNVRTELERAGALITADEQYSPDQP